MLEKIAEALHQHRMRITTDKTHWLQVGSEEGSPTTSEAFRRTSKVSYLGELDVVVNENFLNAKMSFIHMCPFLRSRSRSTQLKKKLMELIMNPIAAYGLSAIVLRAIGRLIVLKKYSKTVDPRVVIKKKINAGKLKREIKMTI